ncbi:LCP family protein [Paenibacillus sp. 1P07SE]|uniref:LCP family glycopolymer transferase n=1 Tax=Paenibacillus sp. 1P07SE TaxID=3132209 RepID=UPI0039A706EA
MSRRRKLLMGCSALVTVILLGALAYGWRMYNAVEDTVLRMYVQVEEDKPLYVSNDPEVKQATSTPAPERLAKRESVTILALGVDERAGDRGRSDTMVVLQINPAKERLVMFNIPRDTRTEIIGRGTIDKINHAYAFGGVEMALATVEHFLDYPIDYYIKVNMEGFARLVDLFGGVEVNNDFAFQLDGHTFAAGQLKLTGTDALAYSRMRMDDPRGDLGRNTRQRQIIQALLQDALQLSTVARLDQLLQEAGQYVRTNASFQDMRSFAMGYRNALRSSRMVEIKGEGRKIGGIWYYIVDEQERARIQSVLKEQL